MDELIQVVWEFYKITVLTCDPSIAQIDEVYEKIGKLLNRDYVKDKKLYVEVPENIIFYDFKAAANNGKVK